MTHDHTIAVERGRSYLDVARKLKQRLQDGYERLVLQSAIDAAQPIIKKGSTAQVREATAELQRNIDNYTY